MGFDGIAVAGEETKNPAKSIPRATVFAMSIVGFLYIFSAMALSLMLPWYDIYIQAPWPQAFADLVGFQGSNICQLTYML